MIRTKQHVEGISAHPMPTTSMSTLTPVPVTDHLDVDSLRRVVTTFRDAVRLHAARLNLLNVYPVPDGDTGSNMASTLDAVVDEMDAAEPALASICDAISHGSLMGARGNSGVILSQILRGVASTLKAADRGTAGATAFADALGAAATGAYQAVLKPVEGTILTVVRDSADAARAAAGAGGDLVDAVAAAHAAGQESLARTPELLPVLRDAGVVDAGGAGYLLFLDAALHVLTGRPLPEAGPAAPAERSVVVAGVDGELDVSEQRYEVMYLCELDDHLVDRFKQGWGAIGDSIVVVGGEGLWNCHIHTNDIGGAIEVALDLGGRPSRIRVTDLFDEVADEHAARDAAIAATDPGSEPNLAADRPPTPGCAVVAVSSGQGLTALFRGLGVAEIVEGGQSANPSTAELVAAVERCGAEHVVLLPNNKNIVAVAEQVDGLTRATVRVVPTRSMPEALAALVAFDPDAGLDHNVAAMVEALGGVATGEVTCAVRDSHSAVGPVAEGDWIGLVTGAGIVSVAADLVDAVTRLLDRLLEPDREILTVIGGTGADPTTTDAILEWLAAEHGDVEVEVHEGGQPLYPYLFGVE